jgi:hypothetical protein
MNALARCSIMPIRAIWCCRSKRRRRPPPRGLELASAVSEIIFSDNDLSGSPARRISTRRLSPQGEFGYGISRTGRFEETEWPSPEPEPPIKASKTSVP